MVQRTLNEGFSLANHYYMFLIDTILNNHSIVILRQMWWELKERNTVILILYSLFYYLSLRIASLSKIFPTLMLYRLWEDGKIGSLDDPLEKYVENFTIKNPLGKMRDSQLKYVTDGLIFLDSGEIQIRSSSVTLRRMASQLSGTLASLCRTNWNTYKGKSFSERAFRWTHSVTLCFSSQTIQVYPEGSEPQTSFGKEKHNLH